MQAQQYVAIDIHTHSSFLQHYEYVYKLINFPCLDCSGTCPQMGGKKLIKFPLAQEAETSATVMSGLLASYTSHRLCVISNAAFTAVPLVAGK